METSSEVAVRAKPGAVALPGQFKRPKPVKKVLEEEEFTEAMSKIIRRDFFPEVPKLQAQLAYLEACDSNDSEKLREISERFESVTDTPAAVATPSTFETPISGSTSKSKGSEMAGNEREGPSSPKKPKPEDAKGLDSFFSQYHSEDDASFSDIMEKSKQQHRARYAWMYDKDDSAVTIPAIEGPEQKLAITDGREGDMKHGEIATWNYTARNSLMYIPDGVEDSLSEKLAKGEQRVIRHANTRLPREFLKQQLAVARGETQGKGDVPQAAREKVGVDGKLVVPSDSPQVNGYGFMATPQIHPGVDASPLMTWGTVDGTPMRLDGDVTATPGPVFKIPKMSMREELGHRLADKAVKSQRDKKKAALAQASSSIRRSIGSSPSSTSERLQSLSPAARKLINRASPSPRLLGGTDKSLRASYTPSHSPSLTPQHTPTHRQQSRATPKRKQSGNQTPSLTDNLLNIKPV